MRRLALRSSFGGTHNPCVPGQSSRDAAKREKKAESWSTPFDLGPNVNSTAAETRPSLSWDGTTLYFGSTRPGGEGSTDHYVTTREKIKKKD